MIFYLNLQYLDGVVGKIQYGWRRLALLPLVAAAVVDGGLAVDGGWGGEAKVGHGREVVEGEVGHAESGYKCELALFFWEKKDFFARAENRT